MALGYRQPKWDIYEAVILLDGYLEVLQGKSIKAQVVKRVSAELRKMAGNRGIDIDGIYRNENGISYQMQSMDSAYKGKKIYVPASRLFEETVDLYRNDTQRYLKILGVAKSMAGAKKNNKDAFLAWTASLLSAQRCKWLEENILRLEHFAFSARMISGSIFDITDAPTLEAIYTAAEKDKVFQITNRKFIKNIISDFKVYIQYCTQMFGQDQATSDTGGASDLQETQVEQLSPEELDDTLSDVSKAFAVTVADSRIVDVLRKHYEYGFKYDSIRELMRFRQFAEAMGITITEDDEILKSSILSAGTVIDGKVYCKSDTMLQELKHIVGDVFSSGAEVIYYESLFENEQEWMKSHVVTSSDMLKEYLQQNITECSFSKKFMVKGKRRPEKEIVTDEIKRIWGSHPSESVYSLHERLPYIPLSHIWRVISGNDHFVFVSEGEYLFIDCFRITESEEQGILDFVNQACEENGFASLNDIPLGSIEEENYELTQSAIYNAIYKRTLSGKYHLNGKILTKEKTELDAVALLKQYIQDKDECTFDEVANKVIELIGNTNRQYAFQALYDDMVRVDKNRFVSYRLVNFPVDEIDDVLSGFITDHFRAIRDITTFAMFPICGQNWNHYLLESFCYKYSRKYSLHVIHFNDKNAGIIAEKDFNKKYNDMLAIAVARTDVELQPDVVGHYLFNTGYLSKSKYAKLYDITQQALGLRGERQ